MFIAVHSHQFLPPTFHKKPKVLSRFWLLLILAIIALAIPARAQSSPSLEWNSNPEPDIAGYVVYLRDGQRRVFDHRGRGQRDFV